MTHNVFCDFLNKEIRRLYGLYNNLNATDHERLIGKWLNAAVLLAPEWCLIPIGFLAESKSLQNVIAAKESLVWARVLRLAMRDASVEAFIYRRRRDYLPYHADYPPLFEDDTVNLLQRYAPALYARSGRTALSFRDQWPASIEEAPVLEDLRLVLTTPNLAQVMDLPAQISDQGLGFTWNAIVERLPAMDASTVQSLRYVLHADFVRGYLSEYDLRVLTRLPYGWRDLRVQSVGGYFDYEWLEASLGPLLPLLLDLSAVALLDLRGQPGFTEFQDRYARVCQAVGSLSELRRGFVHGAQALERSITDLKKLLIAGGTASLGLDFVSEGSALAGYILDELSRRACAYLTVPNAKGEPWPLTSTRVFLEDLDNFEEIKKVPPARVASDLTNGRIELSEDAVQTAIEEILAVSFHQVDWGGEINDLYTANIRIRGRQTATAFMLKGNGLKARTMEIANCGKNGDQLQRLVTSPAEVFVVQYVGPISGAVISDMDGKIRAIRADGKSAWFCIVDGQDTARLLRAYGKI